MESKKQKSNMSKTYLLIAGLIILTVILLAISVTTNENPDPTPTPTPVAEKEFSFITLKFADEPRVSTISGRYELDIDLESDTNEIKLIQIELEYDPERLRVFDIQPGNTLNMVEVLQKEIDPENGRVTYWLTTTEGEEFVNSNGSVATLTFAKTGTGQTTLRFQTKTSIDTSKTTESVLNDLLPIIIDRLPTPSPSPSPVPTNIPTIQAEVQQN